MNFGNTDIPKYRRFSVYRKFRYIGMTKKVIPIYRYEFQYRYFRYIGIPNIPSLTAWNRVAALILIKYSVWFGLPILELQLVALVKMPLLVNKLNMMGKEIGQTEVFLFILWMYQLTSVRYETVNNFILLPKCSIISFVIWLNGHITMKIDYEIINERSKIL